MNINVNLRRIIPNRKAIEYKIKKIVFVSDAIMPYNKGGKEKRLFEITKRLKSDKLEIHIYTMKWWDGPKVIKSEGIFFHSLCRKYPLYLNARRSMFQAIMFGLASFKLLFVRFDVLDVDSIPFFPLFSARLVCWIKGKKMTATWHEVWGQKYWTEYLGGISGFFGSLIERLSFLTPNLIISNSKHTTERLIRAGCKKEIRTIPLGVDLKSIKLAKESGEPSDIIFVGRLLAHKNVDLLIRAVGNLKKTKPDVLCLIVGSGPESKMLWRLIGELELETNVRLIDRIEDNNTVYGLMKSSKMLVLPSIREGFGLVVLEANAAGLPAITINHQDNSAKSLIKDGVNGFVVDLDEKSLREGIVRVLKEREAMHPEFEIEKYDWSKIIEDYKNALDLE